MASATVDLPVPGTPVTRTRRAGGRVGSADTVGSMSKSSTTVDFWFDPICPWAWITSRWMLEVEQVRDVTTSWHLMSLAYLNLTQHEGKGLSPEYLERMQRAWGPVRILAAAANEKGDEILLPLYSAIGTRFHNEQNRGPESLQAALDEVGLDRALMSAAEDDSLDDAIKASHERGMSKVGIEVGTPVISVGDNAFFGPVVTPAPRGEAAGRLWDGVLAVTETDGFFELKRTRDRRPSFE